MGIGPGKDDEMPLAEELPDEQPNDVRRLPIHLQEVWQQAFDEAFEETGNQAQAEAIAWAEARSIHEESDEEERRQYPHGPGRT